MTLFACSARSDLERPRPSTVTTVDTRLDAAATPIVEETPPTTAVKSEPKGLGTCDEAIADAKAKKDMGWKLDTFVLDANGDGIAECVLRGCYSANCDLLIYTRELGGVRLIGEMTASFVSSPHCADKQAEKGTFCRLEVGVHMIHGETQQTFWRYAGRHYVEDGHGELIPGPSKVRHP